MFFYVYFVMLDYYLDFVFYFFENGALLTLISQHNWRHFQVFTYCLLVCVGGLSLCYFLNYRSSEFPEVSDITFTFLVLILFSTCANPSSSPWVSFLGSPSLCEVVEYSLSLPLFFLLHLRCRGLMGT